MNCLWLLIPSDYRECLESRGTSNTGAGWARAPATAIQTMEPHLSPSYKFAPIQACKERLGRLEGEAKDERLQDKLLLLLEGDIQLN